jgi:hypothetical protein
MGHLVRGRSLPVRVLVYAALATVAFVLAAGVGAVGALALRGDVVGLLEGEQPRPTGDQDAAASGVASGGADPKAAEDPAPKTAQGTEGADSGETTFVHTATDANSRGDYTYIGHPRTDGNPDAVVLASPTGPYERNIGVWYEPGEQKWAIFNQDRTAVPDGSAFEVAVPEGPERFVHRAGPDDTVGNAAYLDDPLLNGKPGAEASVTQNWNPGGGVGVYNDHPVGVLYDEDLEKWFVHNEDGFRMPEGAAFNVAVSGDPAP